MSKKGKAGKIKVPKRVAGIKIPKTVRKGPVMDFVNSSAGRLLIAEALTAAVAAFAIKQSDSPTGQRLKAGVSNTGESIKNGSTRLAYAFGEGVRAFREALSDPAGERSAPDSLASESPELEDDEPQPATAEAAKKKSRGSRSDPATASL